MSKETYWIVYLSSGSRLVDKKAQFIDTASSGNEIYLKDRKGGQTLYVIAREHFMYAELREVE